MGIFSLVRNTLIAFLLSSLMVTPSLAQSRKMKTKFFYGGDGHIRLISQKNGKTFSGRFRNDDGHPGNDAYNAICAVFGAQNPTGGRIISLRLIEFLDFIEDRLGPGTLITITSGYRPPEYNANLRKKGALAAKASLHQYGMAADVILEGVPPKQVWQYVQSLGFGGAGYYHGKTVHVDVGPARFWDEKSSGVGTGLSDDNKLIGMVTDFDIYSPGESVTITFIRMTAFPIKVRTGFKLISMENPEDIESQVNFKPDGMGASHRKCVEFKNINQMASLRWSLPSPLPPGRYRITVAFCDNMWDQMPKEIATPEFEIRMP
jgi:hypothetical protein